MAISLDPGLETKVQDVQFLFERYVKNASANCDVLGTVGSLMEGVGLDIPELGGLTQAEEVFGKLKGGVSDTIRQVSQSADGIKQKISELTDLIPSINDLEIVDPALFAELSAEFEGLQTEFNSFTDELAGDLGPAVDAYFQLEDSVADSLNMIRSVNCPLVNDALAAVAPGLSPFLNEISTSINNNSTIRDTVLKKTAGAAIGNISNKVQGITSKFQGRVNTIENVTKSINRIKEKLGGQF